MKVRVNGNVLDVPAPCTVARLLARLELPDRGVAVAVDGAVVPRTGHEIVELVEGARVEILRAVGGG